MAEPTQADGGEIAEVRREDRAWWIAFVACAVAAAIPFLVTPRLPMADLAEHAAQVAIWKHFGDACHDFSALFELNFATPYLLAYAVTRLVAIALPVSLAIRLTVFLGVLLFPLSLRVLLRRSGADPWWALLGFPLAFGFSFYWGFFSFWFALPLAVLYVALLLDRSSRMALLWVVSLLLLAGHALLVLFCAAVTAIVVLLDRAFLRMVPITTALLALVAWAVSTRSSETAVHRAINWHPGVYRPIQFPSVLFANETDIAAVALFAAIVLAVALARPRWSREPRRWALTLAGGAAYLAGPLAAFGTAFLFGRFAVLLAIGLLLLFDVPERRSARSRYLVVAVVAVWMIVLTARFQRFGAEAREFDQVLKGIPPGRSVLTFNVDPFSADVPGPVFLHFGAWYQVEKGGLVAWSFASSFPSLVRYRRGSEPVVRYGSVPRGRIDWEGVRQYDYVIIQGDPGPVVSRAPYAMKVIAQHGRWTLLRRADVRPGGRTCPPLEL